MRSREFPWRLHIVPKKHLSKTTCIVTVAEVFPRKLTHSFGSFDQEGHSWLLLLVPKQHLGNRRVSVIVAWVFPRKLSLAQRLVPCSGDVSPVCKTWGRKTDINLISWTKQRQFQKSETPLYTWIWKHFRSFRDVSVYVPFLVPKQLYSMALPMRR